MMHPHRRAAMEALRNDMPAIKRVEHHYRRTESLMIVSVVAAVAFLGLMLADASPFVRPLAGGLMFGLGLATGAQWIRSRLRRTMFDELCRLHEIAALSLAVEDVDLDEEEPSR
jgi:hypothetical protein